MVQYDFDDVAFYVSKINIVRKNSKVVGSFVGGNVMVLTEDRYNMGLTTLDGKQ